MVSTHCTWTDGLDSNGVNLPTDVLMSEVRSSGRRAHHAPEYLEKRKVDRERRRSSEGGLNTKLRLRRPSRTRKEKEEVSQKSFDALRLAFVLKGTYAIYRDRAHTHTRTHRIHISHTHTLVFWEILRVCITWKVIMYEKLFIDSVCSQKVTRSRSVSRTRDTEDEEMDRKVSTTSAPTSCEKPKVN